MNSDDFLQVVEIDHTLMDVLLQDGNGKNVKCRLAVAVDPESRTIMDIAIIPLEESGKNAPESFD
jgi:hypothetical protein